MPDAPDLPDRRKQLTSAALALLEERGPDAMTTRRVAESVGASSMKVYSAFGSMAGLVGSVVDEGFRALEAAFGAVERTDDPVADLWRYWLAYRDFAVHRPALFRVMYGSSSPGGYRRSGEELLQGSSAFFRHMRAVRRAVAANRFGDVSDYDASLVLWAAAHGAVTLELDGYIEVMPAPQLPFHANGFVTAAVGLGDDRERALRSMGF